MSNIPEHPALGRPADRMVACDGIQRLAADGMASPVRRPPAKSFALVFRGRRAA